MHAEHPGPSVEVGPTHGPEDVYMFCFETGMLTVSSHRIKAVTSEYSTVGAEQNE